MARSAVLESNVLASPSTSIRSIGNPLLISVCVPSAWAVAQGTPATPPAVPVEVDPARQVRIELLAIVMAPWMFAEVR